MPISPIVIDQIKYCLAEFPGHEGYLAAVRLAYQSISRNGRRATPLIYNYSGLRQAVETVKWVQSL